jgi:putative transposase
MSARYVLACHRYIELNPVRAGMVASPCAYRWSSYNGNAGTVQNKLLAAHAEYLALAVDDASRHCAYQGLFAEGDDPAFLTVVREATNGGFPLLGNELKSQLAATTDRRLERSKPGPRRAEPGPTLDLLSADLGL